MRRCIATVCLSGGLEEKIRAAAAAGFEAIELFENDLLCFDGTPREVRDLAADLGLAIDLYQPFRDFEGVGPDQFARNLERAERKFDLMQALAAPMVLVCSNVSPDTLGDPELAADQLRALAERAARRNLRLGFEALAWGARTRHVAEAWKIVEMADHPHLGIVLDSFHMLALGDDPAWLSTIPGEKIAFVQLADAPRLTLDVLSWSRRFRCFPGQGDFDIAGFVQPILQAGYAGPLSLEVFNDEFRSGPTRQMARDGYRSLQLLEEDIRRLEEAKPTHNGGVLAQVDLFDPPAPPRLDGVGFIEFAVDAAAGDQLAAWLEPFGFKYTGHHRSKNVTLHEAGGVHFVLNAEPDSFAQAYFLLHGVSVCALGLQVDDAHRAVSRAGDYRCQRFDGRVGPNELQIPAIRALDGSLIYFIDGKRGSGSLYDIEFARTAEPDAGVTGVDHIAMAVPAGQLDSWALFHRAVLGMKGDAPPQAINDPHGVVRSRAVVDARHAVRFALNVSTFSRTEVAQSIAETAGAGVQQIALACDDLVTLAQGFRDRGAPILAMHENYYEDLASKSLVDPATLERLQLLNILYDRSAEGEFLHAYSPTFEGRFFLEFVQRIGGYDRYGEANAPFRLAAQARVRQAQALGAD
jgi:4-hydroxyphenylpyruvate dioxygenase